MRIYITVAGTIGKVGSIPTELDGANLTENANRLVINRLYKNWLIKCLQSEIVQKQIKGATTKVGQPKLAMVRIEQFLIPLPPLSQQECIVTELEKYEPLITEYDKLEQEKSKLDSEIYDRLKKPILQYIIQGKLVPQDKNDEPASESLKRIRAEKKAQLEKKYVDSYIYKGDDNCYYQELHVTIVYTVLSKK